MTKTKSQKQIEKFRAKARELEVDDSEEQFDTALKEIARHKSRQTEKPNKSD